MEIYSVQKINNYIYKYDNLGRNRLIKFGKNVFIKISSLKMSETNFLKQYFASLTKLLDNEKYFKDLISVKKF